MTYQNPDHHIPDTVEPTDLKQFMLDRIDEEVYILDDRARFLYVNDESCRRLGYSRDELLAMTIAELDPGWTVERWEQHREQLRARKNLRFEASHRTRDGERYPVEVRSSYFEYKKKGYSLAVCRDITERTLNEERYLEKNSLLQTVLDSSPDLVWFKDTQGVYLSCNSALERSFGIPESQIVGKRDEELFEPEAAEACRLSDAEALDAGGVSISEERVTIPDGGEIVMEIRKVPVYREDGELRGILGLGRDVTEQKEAEATIRELAATLEKQVDARTAELQKALAFNDGVINALPDLLFEIDTEGTYHNLWTKDETLLAAEKDRLLGNNIRDVLPPDAQESVLAAIGEAERDGASFGHAYSLALPAGEKWFELSVSKKRDGRLLALCRDITLRKEAEMTIQELAEGLERRVEERTAELQKSLAFIEGVVNAIPDLLFEMDKEGNFLGIWAHDEGIPAAQKEAMLGKNVREVFSPEAADTILYSLEEVEERGSSFGSIIAVEHPRGSRWFELSITKKPGTGYLMLSRDITERKTMEETLISREAEFRALAENLPYPVLRYAPDGRRTYVNRVVERFTGIQASELIGTTISERRILQEDEAQKVMQSIQNVFSSAEPDRVFVRYIAPDGPEMWFESVHVPEFAPDGAVQSVLAVVHDVTMLKELQASETKLTTLVDTIPDMVWLKDTEGRYLFCNPAFERFFGAKESEIVGKRDHDFVDAELADFFIRKDKEAIAAGKVSINEETITYKDNGQTALVEARKFPVRLPDGTLLGIMGIGRDITERKKAEKDLNDSHAFLISMIDAISDPCFVKDREHRWVLLNEAFCLMLGEVREHLLGKSDHDFLPKEQADLFWEKDELVFNSKEVNVNEEPITTGDGSLRYLQTVKTPFTAPDGKEYLVGVIRDITQRKITDEALAQREQAFRTLAENTPDTIARYDRDLHRTYANRTFAELAGVRVEALLGKRPTDTYPTPAGEAYEQKILTALESGEEQELLYPWHDKDGKKVVSHIRIVPERDSGGDVKSVLAVGREITCSRELDTGHLDNYEKEDRG